MLKADNNNNYDYDQVLGEKKRDGSNTSSLEMSFGSEV